MSSEVDTFEVDDVAIIGETAAAFQLEAPTFMVWVPRVHVCAESEVQKKGDKGRLVLKDQTARQKRIKPGLNLVDIRCFVDHEEARADRDSASGNDSLTVCWSKKRGFFVLAANVGSATGQGRRGHSLPLSATRRNNALKNEHWFYLDPEEVVEATAEAKRLKLSCLEALTHPRSSKRVVALTPRWFKLVSTNHFSAAYKNVSSVLAAVRSATAFTNSFALPVVRTRVIRQRSKEDRQLDENLRIEKETNLSLEKLFETTHREIQEAREMLESHAQVQREFGLTEGAPATDFSVLKDNVKGASAAEASYIERPFVADNGVDTARLVVEGLAAEASYIERPFVCGPSNGLNMEAEASYRFELLNAKLDQLLSSMSELHTVVERLAQVVERFDHSPAKAGLEGLVSLDSVVREAVLSVSETVPGTQLYQLMYDAMEMRFRKFWRECGLEEEEISDERNGHRMIPCLLAEQFSGLVATLRQE